MMSPFKLEKSLEIQVTNIFFSLIHLVDREIAIKNSPSHCHRFDKAARVSVTTCTNSCISIRYIELVISFSYNEVTIKVVFKQTC